MLYRFIDLSAYQLCIVRLEEKQKAIYRWLDRIDARDNLPLWDNGTNGRNDVANIGRGDIGPVIAR